MENSTKPWYKRRRGVILIIFLGIILFFLAIGAVKNITKSNLPAQTDQALGGQKYDAAAGDHYWLGSANAKIAVVEFGDFACPVCEKAFPTARELSLKYKKDIKFIWRDYPVVSGYSLNLALAGRCAGEQGLFWPMHDKLFQNQGAGQTDDQTAQTDQLTALANQIGANATKFKDCFNKQKYQTQIKKDLSDGQTFGVAGTPTYFVSGYKIAGDVPMNIFDKMIEQLKK